MPTIVIDGPPLCDMEKKRCLVREMSEAASKAYDLPLDAMVVLVRENTPDNVGIGGSLLWDRMAKKEPGQKT